jgi:hypothetical protein
MGRKCQITLDMRINLCKLTQSKQSKDTKKAHQGPSWVERKVKVAIKRKRTITGQS